MQISPLQELLAFGRWHWPLVSLESFEPSPAHRANVSQIATTTASGSCAHLDLSDDPLRQDFPCTYGAHLDLPDNSLYQDLPCTHAWTLLRSSGLVR